MGASINEFPVAPPAGFTGNKKGKATLAGGFSLLLVDVPLGPV
jgi:hypothetical protein